MDEDTKDLLEDSLRYLEELQWHHKPGTCCSNERYECPECDEYGPSTMGLEHQPNCRLGNFIKRLQEKIDKWDYIAVQKDLDAII